MRQDYVHGYDDTESARLSDQARILESLLHEGTRYPGGCTVLEAGCGTGAQTAVLLRRSPGARFTCVDRSAASLAEAEARIAAAGLPAPRFRRADLLALPFTEASFDHVFVCFVLEHMPRPGEALAELRRVLKPGGSLTVIEGDNGSTLLHPDAAEAHAAIACLVALQRAAGGDGLIGRRLFPILAEAGFADVAVTPRVAYADAGRPDWVDGFVRRTFVAMVAGIRQPAIAAGLVGADAFDRGIQALLRTTEPDGSFGYTFHKAVARRP
ncbi:methyltransferase domain-containing protein [uncultured Methylobacterium sp.]|jgi:SAM-dependent methyltransferase|uniref:methyltransferase domain-containing protein n=1 Tax=uncultured Methylobacterium sp. TaxID=157278 RepID=UPI002616FC10|nr:methyltransferase domain-containing protein [uncultured Methylobacterium sp.]